MQHLGHLRDEEVSRSSGDDLLLMKATGLPAAVCQQDLPTGVTANSPRCLRRQVDVGLMMHLRRNYREPLRVTSAIGAISR